jgi:sugar lactone lactonase YvrE
MYLFEPLTDVRCRVGEGPTWCPERGELWWVDLPRGAWYRYVWATGSVDSRTLSDRLSFVAPDDAGGAIAGIADGLAAVPDTGPIATADLPVEAGLESTFVNDGKVGPDRRLYFGTFDRLASTGARTAPRCTWSTVSTSTSSPSHSTAGRGVSPPDGC